LLRIILKMFHVKHFGKVDTKIPAQLHTRLGLVQVGFRKRVVRTAAPNKFDQRFARWTPEVKM
jgi:hypothetical protein